MGSNVPSLGRPQRDALPPRNLAKRKLAVFPGMDSLWLSEFSGSASQSSPAQHAPLASFLSRANRHRHVDAPEHGLRQPFPARVQQSRGGCAHRQRQRSTQRRAMGQCHRGTHAGTDRPRTGAGEESRRGGSDSADRLHPKFGGSEFRRSRRLSWLAHQSAPHPHLRREPSHESRLGELFVRFVRVPQLSLWL